MWTPRTVMVRDAIISVIAGGLFTCAVYAGILFAAAAIWGV